jgi:uncharacterized protein (DUF427 family)
MNESGYQARPDYRVDLLRRRNRVTAATGETALASTKRPIIVDAQRHGLVVYFPRCDVNLGALAPVDDRTSFCPYKGDASYWALATASAEPIAWSYEQPFDEVAAIRGLIAFYQDRVEVRLGGEVD